MSVGRVHRVLTLVREGGEIADRAEQEAHLLQGLCGIVGGEVAVRFEFDAEVSPRPVAGFVHGLAASETESMFHAYMVGGDGFDLMASRIRTEYAISAETETTPVATCTRGELVADREWYRSSYVNDHRRGWGIDHCVYSVMRAGDAHFGMSINRGFGDAPFSTEERELVQIFHLETAWLARRRRARIEPPGPSPELGARRASLAPRVREVLDALLRGAADKEIAANLAISPHTARQYVKVVYRAFEVTSRAELSAKWFGTR